MLAAIIDMFPLSFSDFKTKLDADALFGTFTHRKNRYDINARVTSMIYYSQLSKRSHLQFVSWVAKTCTNMSRLVSNTSHPVNNHYNSNLDTFWTNLICALQAVELIWSELFIQCSYVHRLILSCSRQTTIQAIEAKLKMMEHSSVKDFEVNNAPAGSLFGHQRPSVSQPSIRRYQSRGRCDSRPYRRPTNHRRWSISVTFSQTLSSDTWNLCCNSLYVHGKKAIVLHHDTV